MTARRTTQTFIDALHRLERERDVEHIATLFADDAEVRNPTDERAHRGRDGARRFWEQYRASFDTIESDFRHVVDAGDTAVLEWTSRGRSSSGEPFEYDGVSVLEFDGERVRRFRAYFDPTTLGAQLTRGSSSAARR